MAQVEILLPSMGESVAEATVTKWMVSEGDVVEQDDTIVEIATDKVDSEVPSEVDGILVEKFFNVDDVVQVGQVIAIIETEEEESNVASLSENTSNVELPTEAISHLGQTVGSAQEKVMPITSNEDRFYSPLVKNIAKQEGVSQAELDAIEGTGSEGRVTKNDILEYINTKSTNRPKQQPVQKDEVQPVKVSESPKVEKAPLVVSNGDDEII